jgi:hypothetical protein
MSLDITLTEPESVQTERCWINITHNLTKMADAAGIYYAIWKPETLEYVYAKDIITVLEKGLAELKKNPDKYKQYEPTNKWGTYDTLVRAVSEYLAKCKEYPEATINVSR